MAESFLVLHGWMGSDEPHWQSWLVGALRARGHAVAFPELPDRDTPERDVWSLAIASALNDGPGVVVCHSLAVVAWLDSVTTHAVPRSARTLLVAPPGRPEVASLAESMRGFTRCLADAAAVSRATAEVRMICSNADPYCAEGAAKAYAAPLGIACDVLADATAHINVASGFGPWPQALAWCLGERGSIDGRL